MLEIKDIKSFDGNPRKYLEHLRDVFSDVKPVTGVIYSYKSVPHILSEIIPQLPTAEERYEASQFYANFVEDAIEFAESELKSLEDNLESSTVYSDLSIYKIEEAQQKVRSLYLDKRDSLKTMLNADVGEQTLESRLNILRDVLKRGNADRFNQPYNTAVRGLYLVAISDEFSLNDTTRLNLLEEAHEAALATNARENVIGFYISSHDKPIYQHDPLFKQDILISALKISENTENLGLKAKALRFVVDNGIAQETIGLRNRAIEATRDLSFSQQAEKHREHGVGILKSIYNKSRGLGFWNDLSGKMKTAFQIFQSGKVETFVAGRAGASNNSNSGPQ